MAEETARLLRRQSLQLKMMDLRGRMQGHDAVLAYQTDCLVHCTFTEQIDLDALSSDLSDQFNPLHFVAAGPEGKKVSGIKETVCAPVQSWKRAGLSDELGSDL